MDTAAAVSTDESSTHHLPPQSTCDSGDITVGGAFNYSDLFCLLFYPQAPPPQLRAPPLSVLPPKAPPPPLSSCTQIRCQLTHLCTCHMNLHPLQPTCPLPLLLFLILLTLTPPTSPITPHTTPASPPPPTGGPCRLESTPHESTAPPPTLPIWSVISQLRPPTTWPHTTSPPPYNTLC